VTPHENVTAEYFLINTKGNKKVKLDPKPKRITLEAMSSGWSIGQIVTQEPDTYYFLVDADDLNKPIEIKAEFITKNAKERVQ